MPPDMSQMSKADRDALIRIVKSRARQAKAEADQRRAVLQAELENEITAEYQARDALWAQAVEIAEQHVAKANAEVEAACLDLGVPPKHAPQLQLGWRSRSPHYADKDRRAELRKLGETRLAALTKTAKTMIDAEALKVEETLIIGGLESTEAREIIAAMPTVEALMPALGLQDLGVTHWQPPEGAANELMAPLTPAGRKRRRILRAIEADPGASNRAIARTAQVDHKTVAAVRGEASGEFPAEYGEIPTGGDD